MKIMRAIKLELDPTRQQAAYLGRCCGAARWIYNWGLAERIKAYAARKADPSLNPMTYGRQSREFTALRNSGAMPWLAEIPAVIAHQALYDLDQAYHYFFHRLKSGAVKPGFPKFRKRSDDGRFRVQGDGQRLKRDRDQGRWIGLSTPPAVEKVGGKSLLSRIRLKEHKAIDGHVLSATITRRAGRWYVAMNYETEIPDPQPVAGPAIGIDMGCKTFATAVDEAGDVRRIDAPLPLLKQAGKIRRLQRIVARRRAGSGRRQRAVVQLSRLYQKARYARQDFLHKLTTQITKENSTICVEGLQVTALMQCRFRGMANKLSDMAWGEFRRQLTYKSQWYGSQVVVLDRFEKSTGVCDCGHELKLKLSEREWTCPSCGTHHDRDIQAARTILKKGLGQRLAEVTRGEMGSYSEPKDSQCPSSSREPVDCRVLPFATPRQHKRSRLRSSSQLIAAQGTTRDQLADSA